MPQKFPRTFSDTDFVKTGTSTSIDEGSLALVTGSFQEVATYQTPAQQEIALGSGGTGGGVDTRRKIYLRFDSASGQIHGVIRLALANANKTNIRVVMEDRTENLDDGVELGETEARAKEDSYLIIYFNPDNSTTIDFTDANQDVRIPATVYQ